MIFKGLKFKRSKTVVSLPASYAVQNGLEGYVCFGRVLRNHGDKLMTKAIRTDWQWEGTSMPVYAVPIPLKGHSLTNMAYGIPRKDWRGDVYTPVYLMWDARCYTSRIYRQQEAS